jgi:peptidoglycan/LPS O-acetylase OafA/YrhL
MVLTLHVVSVFGMPACYSMNQGVEIFFCISGFVMYVSTYGRDMSAGTFLRRRFIRVIPLYWVFLSVYILEISRGLPPAKEILLSYLFLRIHWPVLTVGWTLSFELFFYLCFAVTLFFRKSPLWLIPPFLGLAFLDNRFLCFLAGMLIGALEVKGRRINKGAAVVICGIYLFAIAMFPGSGAWAASPILMALSCLLVLAAVSLEGSLRRSRMQLLLVLGDASYVLYLSHILVLHGFAGLTRHGYRLPHVLAPLAGIACCLIAVLLHRILEVPLLNFLNRAVGGRAPVTVGLQSQ